ncbi:MAG: DUF1624 domain-containing protein [Asgard group archaeon]|nr:DUF1624 domain-containing protein [Asgard group archaeon]
MNVNLEIQKGKFIAPRRFVSIDFARSIAIFIMLTLHNVMSVLNINGLMAPDVINTLPMIQLFALIIIPFFGGLAGFFLLVSAASNTVSMYSDLERGTAIGGLVFKQVFSGILLLIFAMLSEAITGYNGVVGEFFKHLNNLSVVFDDHGTWEVIRYRFNHFETIHTIAWCIIINGIIQGLLSLKKNWRNRKQLIIIYAVLAIIVIAVTQTVWNGVEDFVWGYAHGTYPNGHLRYLPWFGYEPTSHVFRSFILAPLAAQMEPIFPYLAVSFLGCIFGIVLSQPKEKITKKFTKTSFAVGFVMFFSGLIGIVFVLLAVIKNATVGDPIEIALLLYKDLPFHRNWSPDNHSYIPAYSYIPQFLALNGFSLLMFTLLFRVIEFRGRSKQVAENTKIIRRYGIVAFSNYNNQWLYWMSFGLVSSIYTAISPDPSVVPYERMFWGGTFINIIITLVLYMGVLWLWEKIAYTGSLEFWIRTITNNIVPVRRAKVDNMVKLRPQEDLNIDYTKSKISIWFKKLGLRIRGKVVDNKLKWWQRGQIDVENLFYNPNWVDIVDRSKRSKPKDTAEQSDSEIINQERPDEDSRLAFRFAMIGMFSIVFVALSFFALVIGLRARKEEGENKHNKTAIIISIITIVLLAAFIIVSLIIKVGVLGIF